MDNRKTTCIAICAFLIFAQMSQILAIIDCSNLDRHILIKSQKSGLIMGLSGTLTIIILHEYEQHPETQFKLDLGSNYGVFKIISITSQLAIDVTGDATDGYIAYLNPPNATRETQEFYINSDGAIVNKGIPNYALDIQNGDFKPGNYIILSPHDDSETERWSLVFSDL